MEIKLPLNTEFIENIILQRTNRFIELGGQAELTNWVKTGEKKPLSSFLKKNNLVQKYLEQTFEDIQKEAVQISNNLDSQFPSNASLVSIGPGNCVFELLLYKHLGIIKKDANLISSFLLIDIEETYGLHQHMFHEKGSGYANLNSAKDFLKNNDVTSSITTCNPAKGNIPKIKYDLLISLYSMGFHYPLDDYIDYILFNSNERALLVFDSRHGQNEQSIKKIESEFVIYKQLNFSKWRRIFFKKL